MRGISDSKRKEVEIFVRIRRKAGIGRDNDHREDLIFVSGF